MSNFYQSRLDTQITIKITMMMTINLLKDKTVTNNNNNANNKNNKSLMYGQNRVIH